MIRAILAAVLLSAVSSIGFAGEKAEKVQPPTGTMRGEIRLKTGEPLAGGKILFFREGAGPPPVQTRYWRTPDDMAVLDSAGRFAVQLPEGKYYISVVRKHATDDIGPPTESDIVYPEARKNLAPQQTLHTVERDRATDIGTIAEAVPFRRQKPGQGEVITAIDGIALGPEGKPLAGALILAYPTTILTGKPLYVSERTGADGKFRLKVADGGTYYLKMRTSLRAGHPEPGEILGFHGIADPLPVSIATGAAVGGITIRGHAFSNYDLGEYGKPDGAGGPTGGQR